MLSIIYINYFSSKLILESIRSLYRFKFTYPHEIIVVNNSIQDNLDILKNAYPTIKIVNLPKNIGFGRANNEGVKHAIGNKILFLNDDTYFINDSLNRLIPEFEQSEFGLSTLQLYYPTNIKQPSGFRFVYGGLNVLLKLPLCSHIIPFLKRAFKLKNTIIENEKEGVVEVDWINGAFMLFKKNLFEKIGGFDEDFFLYAEEIELCSRFGKHHKIALYEKYSAVHIQGQSSSNFYNQSAAGYDDIFSKRGLQIMLSNFVRIRKQYGVFWLFVNYLIFVLEGLIMPITLLSFKKTYLFLSNMLFISSKFNYIFFNKKHFYKI